ncbi:MAG TPA: hypothetical protein VM865_09395 [Acidobacteriaceae bacterium]|jgi:hypothetical protein|nr:hypothetical protein [Acidobacteriaceae bacterium]
MKDARQGDGWMAGTVLAGSLGFLEAARVWGDSLHRWRGMGLERKVADFALLPMMILMCLLRAVRPRMADGNTE